MDNSDTYRSSMGGNCRKGLSLRLRVNLFDLSVIYIISWVIIPAMSRGIMFRIVAIISSIIVLVRVLYKRTSYEITNYIILSSIMILTFIVCFLIGNGSIPISKSINLSVYIILSLIAQYYYFYEKVKLKSISLYIITLYLIIIIPSLIAVQHNPYVLRNASGEHVRNGIELLSGSYGYVFGCVLLIIFLSYNLHNGKESLLLKIIQIGCILALCILVLNSGLTTAIILSTVGIVAALSINKNRFRTIIISGLAAMLLIHFVPIVLEYILSHWDVPAIYKNKMIFLNRLIGSSGDVSYSDSTRGSLLIQGLNTIARYPFIGSVIVSGKEAAGGHQEIIDVMANYGIIYALLFYRIILETPYRLMKSDKSLRLLYLLVIIFWGLTDTFDFTTMTIPLFVGTYFSLKNLGIEG